MSDGSAAAQISVHCHLVIAFLSGDFHGTIATLVGARATHLQRREAANLFRLANDAMIMALPIVCQ